jgi:dTDP-glucose pyrophosphorylase
VIANSDQFIEHDHTNGFINCLSKEPTIHGLIMTFKSTHPKWSFVALDKNGYVTRVAEKEPISDVATVGIYGWKHGSDYVRYAEQMISKNIRVNNEFYVAPVYNESIADSQIVAIHEIKRMWGIGTPEDLDFFLKHYSNLESL